MNNRRVVYVGIRNIAVEMLKATLKYSFLSYLF